MLSVAICDDDKVFCKQLKESVEKYLSMLAVEYNISLYNTVESIFFDLSACIVFDVIFLDIEFVSEKRNGVNVGKYLRDDIKNYYSQIVYVSGQEKYAMQLFEVQPLDFLIKPVKEEKIQKELDRVLCLKNEKQKVFSFKVSKQLNQIELGKILYFEAEGRKVRIVCVDDKEYLFIGKISEVHNKVRDTDFFSPHKSFVVNYYAVKGWTQREIIILNGDHVPISRNNIEEIKKLQLKYEGRNL